MSQLLEVPHGLAKLEEEVARWRRVRKLPCPMPAKFWERAVVLAGELGVGNVARAALESDQSQGAHERRRRI